LICTNVRLRVTGQNRTTQRRDALSTTTADLDAELLAWLRTYPRTIPGVGCAPRFTMPAVRSEPWRNGYIESFNSRVRDECLNINIFWSLVAQARVIISGWKEDYNHRRRRSSFGYQAPAVYAAACTHR